MRHILLLLVATGFFTLSGCKTASTSMQVLVPAQIDLPTNIKSVGIANRSLPGKQGTIGNVLEGLISGESVFADREGSERCMAGLAAGLNASPRFQASIIHGAELKGTGTKQFPRPMEWNEVDRLCKQYQVDALAVLETFDSDIFIEKKQQKVKRKVDDREVYVTEYIAELNITVNAGWRLYDNTSRRIVDENVYSDQKRWNGKGDKPDEALNRLPSKREAINQAGYYGGERYGVRISPTWMNVTRSYYTKGNDALKKAKSFVKAGNWEGAAEIWQKQTLNTDPEIAGRACYNMAVASEVLGNLDIALNWANRALKQHNNKKAAAYIRTLNERLSDQRRLDRQMPVN